MIVYSAFMCYTYCMKNTKLLIILLLSSIFISCGSVAPFQDKAKAEKSLDNAQTVEAETYAQEDYKKANALYAEADELMVTNKKAKENEEAKAKFLEAEKQAALAYSNALPPYTKTYIDETDKTRDVVKKNKAHVATPNLFNEALEKQNQAKEAFDSGDYEKAKQLTQEAELKFKEAEEVTLEKKDKASKSLDEAAELFNKIQTKSETNEVPATIGGEE